MKYTSRLLNVVVAVSSLLVLSSCSGEANDSSAPVQLIVTHTATLDRIDLIGGTDCDQNVGTFSFRTILKNPALEGQFTEVRMKRYRVSYVRVDGGTAVPAPFVNPVNFVVTGSASGGDQKFQLARSEALIQAPFVALRPSNGGRDPETGRSNVRMDVIVEFYGETLGGDDVYANSRQQLEFCYDCGGCS